MKSGVYRIDLGGGWFYVGSSQHLLVRKTDHLRALRRGNHCNSIMQGVFNKYGVFEFAVIGLYPKDKIIEREQQLLDEHSADPKCANIALVAAGGPMAGRKFTAEHRAAISAGRKGIKMAPRTDEYRAMMSAATKGKKKSPAHRASMMGRKYSAETLAKMSASQTARWVKYRSDKSAG
jgi:group I intron endonuclease